MVSYRGPNARRVASQFTRVAGEHGQGVVWRHYVSASTGTASGYYAGAGTTRCYAERGITGLMAAPQMGESRFREYATFGGQVLAGDMVLSCPHPLGQQDEIVWQGTTYRVESDSTPIRYANVLWYRTLLRRGDATG